MQSLVIPLFAGTSVAMSVASSITLFPHTSWSVMAVFFWLFGMARSAFTLRFTAILMIWRKEKKKKN